MRELPMTLALSVLVHVIALAWYVESERAAFVLPTTPASATTAPNVATASPLEAPPIEVTFLDPDAHDGVSAAVAPRERARPHTTITKATTAATELPQVPVEPPPALPTTTPRKRSLLAMRDELEQAIPRPTDGVSDETLKQMVEGTLPVKITNLPGAREAAAFDRASARLHDSTWVRRATSEEVAAARIEREAASAAKKAIELVEQKDGTFTSETKTFTARVNRDGTVAMRDKPNWQWKSPFHAEFDTTDAFMRGQGQDPYASAKRAFLDRTRDQRVEIGRRERTAQLGRSAQHMARNLAALWAMTTDPTKRKEELFALWDECAETGDDEIVDGAAEARRLLVNWIRAKQIAFTPAELAALNARRQSKSLFAP